MPSSILQSCSLLTTARWAVLLTLAGVFLIAMVTAPSLSAAGGTIEVVATDEKVVHQPSCTDS